jgi:hypothetical protein
MVGGCFDLSTKTKLDSRNMDENYFKSMKVTDLKDFLRKRGKPHSGNKECLIHMALTFALDPEVQDFLTNPSLDAISLVEQRKFFDKAENQWNDVETITSKDIPPEFCYEVFHAFLTEASYAIGDDDPIPCGTQKPVTKGRQIYNSSKIQLCEVSNSASCILFRATIEASMSTARFR